MGVTASTTVGMVELMPDWLKYTLIAGGGLVVGGGVVFVLFIAAFDRAWRNSH